MRRALLAAVLAGCTTVGPDYERPEVALPEKYIPETEASAPSVSPDWWTLYNDATLNGLVAATRKGNVDLRLAAARVREAEALLRETGAAFLPEVAGGYSATRNRVSTRTTPPPQATAPLERSQHTLSASTSFELDFWGRFARASEAARAALLGSQFSYDVVELTLSGAVAQAYFALRSLDAQIEVIENTLRVRRASLEIARARADAGLASELDVHQAQAALADALVQRREAQRQRALVERQIATLTGQLDTKIASADLFALPVPPAPPAGLPSALLDRRPDIRSAEQSLAAANAQIGVARAALFPTVSLTGALGAQSAELSDLLASGAGIWSLGFGLSLPIFDAGRREARVEQADARREQALANYQRSIETAFREVSDALVNVGESAGTEADLAARLQAARSALELSTLRYESGYSPYLEVLDAQRTANEAELAFVRNRQARLAFSVDLMKALGGGWKQNSGSGS
ncbi:MAG TPA: efflux transporter outer membrane subunit [Burkholderiales bacterium]